MQNQVSRRDFLAATGGITLSNSRSRFYTLDRYYLKNGSQPPRLHEYFAGVKGPQLILEALVAPHVPQLLVIQGFSSLTEVSDKPRLPETLWPVPEQPWESLEASILEATPYSPELVPAAEGAPTRVFEVRTYHSPSFPQLKALHERFAGPEIAIFHRVGVFPVLYGSMIAGQHLPNLTYVIPFESLAAREQAWTAFGADDEWIQVRTESIKKGGQIASINQISLYKATAYSPVR